MNQNNLTYLAERIQNGKWLIHKSAYESLAKQVDTDLTNNAGLFSRIANAAASLTVKKTELDSTFTPDEPKDDGKIYSATIAVNGVLIKGVSEELELAYGLCNTDRISQALDEAMADDSVKEIVLHFSSPGGETMGIEVLARKINQLSQIKPIYGWTDTQSASAAYWLMSQCNVICLTPDAQVGSVGVYCMLQDYSEALKKDGIKVEAIFAGKFKMLGHGFKPLTDEERNILKADIDNTYIKFKAAVTSKRTINDDDLQGLMFEGTSVYQGQSAVDKGYADLTSDTLTEYLENNDDMKDYTKIVKSEVTEKVAIAPVITPKAEEPKQEEPKAEVKAEEPAKEEPKKDEEMKSAKVGENNTIACPHCEAKFHVEVEDYGKKDEEEKAASDEGVTEPEDNAEEKEEPKEATYVLGSPKAEEPEPLTHIASLFGIPTPKVNPFTAMCDDAVNERTRGDFSTIGKATKPKGAFASMVESAVAERTNKK